MQKTQCNPWEIQLIMQIFEELKRRKVYSVAVAYAAVAWVVLEAADLLLDKLIGAPSWIFQSIFVVLLLGFPIALILSWTYDLTNKGIQKTPDFETNLNAFAVDDVHRLVAVMCTDMVGHQRQLEVDRHKAVQVIQQERKIIEALVLKYNGKVVDFSADDSASIFNNSYDAALCAIDINSNLASLNLQPIRVGISMGDVALADGHAYGTEIGIAQSLIKFSKPGGIVVSSSIRQSLETNSKIQCEQVGELSSEVGQPSSRAFKIIVNENELFESPVNPSANIKKTLFYLPVVMFSIVLITMGMAIYYWFPYSTSSFGLSQHPKIAVIPFINNTGDKENEYFVNSLTDELIFLFAGVKGLDVASSTSSFSLKNLKLDVKQIAARLGASLLLEGTLLEKNGEIRVFAQLIDPKTDDHIWQDEFIYPEDQSQNIQQQVAESVIFHLREHLPESSKTANLPKAQSSLSYKFYLEARERLRLPKNKKNITAAIVLFQKSIQEDSSYVRAYAGLCDAYLVHYDKNRNTESITDAEVACLEANRLNPTDNEVIRAQGFLHLLAGEHSMAIEKFKAALEFTPYDVDALVGLSRAQRAEKDFIASEANIIKAIKNNPGDFRALKGAGVYYYWRGQHAKAAEYFQQALDISPGNASLINNLGAAYQMAGDFQNASISYEKSIEISPNSAAYLNIGKLYYYLGFFEKSQDSYDKGIKLARKDVRIWSSLATTLYFLPNKKQRFEEALRRAIALAEEELSKNNKNIEVKTLLAHMLDLSGKAEESKSLFDLIIIDATGSGNAKYYAAIQALRAGDTERSLRMVEAAINDGFHPYMIEADPYLRPLLSNQKFKQILFPKREVVETN